MFGRARLLGCIGVLTLVIPLGAQTPEATGKGWAPTLTIHARAVVVDVVVTKAGDEPVTGLRQSDFKILEDGKEQKIDLLEEHAASESATAAPSLPANVFTNAVPVSEGGAVNVVLVDELNTSPQDKRGLLAGVREFMNNMPPHARVSIFMLRSKLTLLRGFTSEISSLQSALSKSKLGGSDSVGSRIQGDDVDDRITQALFDTNGGRYTGGEAVQQLQASEQTRLTVRALQELGRNLAGVPGRKNLIWFAGAFPVSLFPQGNESRSERQGSETERQLREATGLMSEAKIAVYPVAVQGIVNNLSSNAETRSEAVHGADILKAEQEKGRTRDANIAAMEMLARDTGGEAVYNTNDFKNAAKRALRDASHFYTLVYTPANTQTDEKFHRIEVKAGGGNLNLAYRRGYYASNTAAEETAKSADPLPSLLRQGSPSATEVVYQAQVEVVSPQPATEAPKLGGNSKLAGPTTRYRVDFKIAGASLALEPATDGTHSGKVETALVAYDREGNSLNWAGSQMALTLNAASFDAAQREGLALQVEIDLPSKAATIQTGIYDLNVQKAGTLELPMSATISTTPSQPMVQGAARGKDEVGGSHASEAAGSSQPAPGPQPTSGTPVVPPVSAPGQPAPTESGKGGRPDDPVLVHRPPPRTPGAVSREGRLQLDVVVSDRAGNPVTGLEPWNFTVLDNDAPKKIMTFRRYGVALQPDPPVEVILLIDELNLPFQQVAIVRSELTEFLQQNGGQLVQPLTIMLLTDKGLRIQERPSTDGNGQLSLIKGIKANISSINSAMGASGALQRFQISVHQLATIAENEARKPGRKLLIWLGPGWPLLQSANFSFTEKDQRRNFDGIVELTNKLREARIVVNSVSLTDPAAGDTPATRVMRYQDFLKGVQTPKQAEAADMGLAVLVSHTGGRILGPDNDLVGQINRCIADANVFYRLSFDPAAAARTDEYHDLKVQVNQPGLTVRTNTGYYDQPVSY